MVLNCMQQPKSEGVREISVVDNSLHNWILHKDTRECIFTTYPDRSLFQSNNTTYNKDKSCLCWSDRQSPPSQIINPTSASFLLLDTSSCCALKRKVGGNYGCGGYLSTVELIS